MSIDTILGYQFLLQQYSQSKKLRIDLKKEIQQSLVYIFTTNEINTKELDKKINQLEKELEILRQFANQLEEEQQQQQGADQQTLNKTLQVDEIIYKTFNLNKKIETEWKHCFILLSITILILTLIIFNLILKSYLF
eukprot:TRINITY_DN590_c0_g9_i1.p1 TRINITY_DN590_c0_g9~~TRINITY_DN590_c0_g9_i1.p1  ORF type:complete len:137 (-),score=56.31 TRINITY_DN590_c0_g9_i1:130-540(-)